MNEYDAHQRNGADRRHRPLGPHVHRPRGQLLQELPGTEGPLRRTQLAGDQTRQNQSPGVPRPRPIDRRPPTISWCRSGPDVIGTNLPFARVILEDFEFISAPGERPDVVCGVFHDLSTGQTTRLWRDQLSDRPPYDDRTGHASRQFCFQRRRGLPSSARLAVTEKRFGPERRI